MTRLDMAQERLKQAGMRMTSTRFAVISLLSTPHTFFTIEQLSKQSQNRAVDTVTVYRIVQAFENLGLVKKIISVNAYMAWPHDEIEDQNYRLLIDPQTQKAYVDIVDTNVSFPSGFVPKQEIHEIVGSFVDETHQEVEDIVGENRESVSDSGAQKIEVSGSQSMGEDTQLHQKLKDF